jgi:hypothetical protein
MAHVGGRQSVAAIGLVRLHPYREVMNPLPVDHWNQDGMVRRMGAAVIGRVVEKRIAPFQIGMQIHHGAGHEIRPAQVVDRERLSAC